MISNQEVQSPVRSSQLGIMANLPEECSVSKSLEMFRKTCFNRYFELETARVYDTGIMKMPIYLSLGQEHIPAAISAVTNDLLIFAQHRAHSYYLSFGGNTEELIDEFVGQSVDIYKINTEHTKGNLYGESTTKYFNVGF